MAMIGLCFAVDKVHLMYDGDTEWYAFVYGLFAQQFIISLLLYSRYSYGELKAKTLACMICIFPIIEAFLFHTDAYYWQFFSVLSALSFAWLFFAMFRPYEPVSDQVEPNKIYWIASKPKRHTAFFISLFGSPVGGSSLLINNKIYGFHDGEFEERDMTDRLNIVATDSGLKVTQWLTDYLSSMEGRKWSWVNNCLTMRLRVQLCQKR